MFFIAIKRQFILSWLISVYNLGGDKRFKLFTCTNQWNDKVKKV